MKIPVVDFGAYRLGREEVPDDKLGTIIKEMNKAFTEIGFVYLENTGIEPEEVKSILDISKTFFFLPEDIKKQFNRSNQPSVPNHGWAPAETESLNPLRPGDLKESFNIVSIQPDIVTTLSYYFTYVAIVSFRRNLFYIFMHLFFTEHQQMWPSEEVLAGFRRIMESFFTRCEQLSLRILRVMALILGLDSDYFVNAHKRMNRDKNATTLRTLYYPPVDMSSVKEGQIRCGEHSDYGTITLVFQSSEGGLEVMNRSGEYISVPHIPGTILINIADLMQRWTSDYFVSAKHRVLLPPAEDKNPRQSVAFFVDPDDDAIISCCDNSNKYPPIKTLDYINERFFVSYGKQD
ncbi:YQK1 protein, partial [Amia calva]|nr:YQK1 protein [Amia calva]